MRAIFSWSIGTPGRLPVDPKERLAGRALLNMIMEDETEPSSELLKAYGEVAHACAGRRGRHARLVAELMRAVHARDAFIAIAAHELRNPMTPMLGYVEHILSVARRPETECPEAIIIALERLANQMVEYIKRATTLLDVSRITAGKLRAELSVVDLSANDAASGAPASGGCGALGLPPRAEHRRRGNRGARRTGRRADRR